jgi:hypothetical protein
MSAKFAMYGSEACRYFMYFTVYILKMLKEHGDLDNCEHVLVHIIL